MIDIKGELRRVAVDSLHPNGWNPNRMDDHEFTAVKRALEVKGQVAPLVVRAHPQLEGNWQIIDGEHRHRAAADLGMSELAVYDLGVLPDSEAMHLNMVLTETRGASDSNDLGSLVRTLAGLGVQVQELSETVPHSKEKLAMMLELSGQDGRPSMHRNTSLLDDFLEPPLSVLNASGGRWKARKRMWLDSLPKVKGDAGRDGMLARNTPETADAQFYEKKDEMSKVLGRNLSTSEFIELYYDVDLTDRTAGGTSHFDPVLAELMTIWFSPPGGLVIDPFAGGVERGLVAAAKGRHYHGIELRERQVKANCDAAGRMKLDIVPKWTCGDALNADDVWESESADLLFACPPYWNLEPYSDDPADLSNMPYEDFVDAHANIVQKSVSALRNNRFVVWVMAAIRHKRGLLDLPRMAIAAFEDAGCWLHGDFVLVTNVGSRRMMARRQFEARRTYTKRHESVLVFCKGSAKTAALALGDVNVGDIPIAEYHLDKDELL